MIKIYGTMLCKDCVQCRQELDRAGVCYEYLDFADSILYLKEFLKLRDSLPLFTQVKEAGGIGVPCILLEDGTVTLDWQELLM